jgi:SOS response regulatory protein OraA/RecX
VFSRSIRRTSQRKKAVQCVTISLYEKGVNKSATTSGIQEKRSTASTVANVSKKLAGK